MAAENKSILQIPHDLEAEQAVLGAVIYDNQMINDIASFVTPNTFHEEAHRHIFRAMLELVEIKKPIDEILLGDQLKEWGKLDEVGGYAYLAELVTCTPSSGNVVYYARIIEEHALLRDIIATTSDISRKSRDPQQPIEELLNEAETKLSDIRNRATKKSYTQVKDSLQEAFARLEEISKTKSEITGLPTGYTDLDRITAGLQPSDLIILAARPSMGKSALALNIATYVAVRSDTKGAVLVFSLEMSKIQLTNRMLSSESRIDADKLKTGNLKQEDWDKLARATDRLSVSSMFLNDDQNLTPYEVLSICRKLDREFEHGIALIVLDYLQLMRGDKKTNSREQEVSEISRSLKGIAKELNVPVIALSQLNRDLEKRTDKRPKLSDLRESGSLEQDSDIILFIYRDEIYNEDTEKKGIAEIIIAKHRNGPIGMIELVFTGKHTKFTSMSRYEPPSTHTLNRE